MIIASLLKHAKLYAGIVTLAMAMLLGAPAVLSQLGSAEDSFSAHAATRSRVTFEDSIPCDFFEGMDAKTASVQIIAEDLVVAAGDVGKDESDLNWSSATRTDVTDNYDIAWKSSKTTTAKVDASGSTVQITPLKAGNSKITWTATNKSNSKDVLTRSVLICVEEPAFPEEGYYTGLMPIKVMPNFVPEFNTAVWTTDSTSIVSLAPDNSDGSCTVKGLKYGTAKVSVVYKDDDGKTLLSLSTQVNVVKFSIVPVKGEAKDTIEQGEVYRIRATPLPDYIKGLDPTHSAEYKGFHYEYVVKFISSNDKVALPVYGYDEETDSYGEQIIGVGPGVATITAKLIKVKRFDDHTPDDEELINSATCHLTVESSGITATIDPKQVKVSSAVYTGKAINAEVTVWYCGKKLVNGRDYRVVYKNNTVVGKGTAFVAGQGGYGGVVAKDFKITPKKISIKKLKPAKKGFTVKTTKATSDWASGYMVRVSLNSNMSGSKSIKFSKSETKNSGKVSKLKKKKTYYVQGRVYKTVDGKTYYGAWSAIKSVKTK